MVNSVSSISFTLENPAAQAPCDNDLSGDFLFGPENALLKVALRGVSARTARYCPLVFVGPSGVGKSHFVRGLARRYAEKYPSAKTILCSGADFARAYAAAVEVDSLNEFRDRYRSVDLLVLDNLEELSTKPSAQLELLHTVDDLNREKRHTLITARRDLADLHSLLPGLKSRLLAGLIVPVVLPAQTTRRAILRNLAQRNSLALPDHVIDTLVAGTTETPSPFRTVPELRNALLEFHTRHATDGDRIDTQVALRFVASQACGKQPSLREIVKQVARGFHLRSSDVTGVSRRQGIVRARGVAIYLARQLTGASYQKIGRLLGGRDHTTVLHAYRRTATLIQTDAEIERTVNALTEQILGKRIV